MTVETIENNCRQFKQLFDRYLDFDDEYEYFGHQPGDPDDAPVQNKEPEAGKAISVNNAKWLMGSDHCPVYLVLE